MQNKGILAIEAIEELIHENHKLKEEIALLRKKPKVEVECLDNLDLDSTCLSCGKKYNSEKEEIDYCSKCF